MVPTALVHSPLLPSCYLPEHQNVWGDPLDASCHDSPLAFFGDSDAYNTLHSRAPDLKDTFFSTITLIFLNKTLHSGHGTLTLSSNHLYSVNESKAVCTCIYEHEDVHILYVGFEESQGGFGNEGEVLQVEGVGSRREVLPHPLEQLQHSLQPTL